MGFEYKEKAKGPDEATCDDEGGQGTLKYTSDDTLFLHLISSSVPPNTTQFVISFFSKEAPDVTGAAIMPEKHLTSHSAAQECLPCSAFSEC